MIGDSQCLTEHNDITKSVQLELHYFQLIARHILACVTEQTHDIHVNLVGLFGDAGL